MTEINGKTIVKCPYCGEEYMYEEVGGHPYCEDYDSHSFRKTWIKLCKKCDEYFFITTVYEFEELVTSK